MVYEHMEKHGLNIICLCLVYQALEKEMEEQKKNYETLINEHRYENI